jgi:hypothetical protein
MSSSQNSGKMRSFQQLESRRFEKYGMTFLYGVEITTRTKYDAMFRLKDGTLVSKADFDVDKHKDQLPENGQLTTEWLDAGVSISTEAVKWCRLQDDEHCASAKDVELFITADGQILGIILESKGDDYVLLDPCLIQYDPRTNAINYKPIFGVQRTLRLAKTAVRARMTPAEIIIGAYPGFLVQHRMYKYQLKPSAAFNKVIAADNDASAVEVKTT